MEPQDIFDAINKVRENPNAIINQIKDQLKRCIYLHLDSNPVLYIETKIVLGSGQSQEKQVGKMRLWPSKDRNPNLI